MPPRIPKPCQKSPKLIPKSMKIELRRCIREFHKKTTQKYWSSGPSTLWNSLKTYCFLMFFHRLPILSKAPKSNRKSIQNHLKYHQNPYQNHSKNQPWIQIEKNNLNRTQIASKIVPKFNENRSLELLGLLRDPPRSPKVPRWRLRDLQCLQKTGESIPRVSKMKPRWAKMTPKS